MNYVGTKYEHCRVNFLRMRMEVAETHIREINSKRYINKRGKYSKLSKKDINDLSFYRQMYKEYSNQLSELLMQ